MYNITVSILAAEQIKLQLAKRNTPQALLRLGVKGGGCSGYEYVIQFEDCLQSEKDLLFTSEGVNLVVDKKSILLLNNSILDWERNLLKWGFKINNPLHKSSCGCGKSFDIKK